MNMIFIVAEFIKGYFLQKHILSTIWFGKEKMNAHYLCILTYNFIEMDGR
ncbi:hypothetical protein BBUCA112A_H0025 (plasmid) [Borreliella burgdorferi CA-11.2A]|nr:hypothetical protein BBU64B_H0029 [Borreliella burgdorferi 64b]ACN56234.1 hypothetical protein BBUCA112A_H0025 [Borreliella burgdorferi CA-11.2A]ACN92521.1 hypothetical protein BBU94A_H27 [Borreliella burgdorferi 94a]